MYPLHYRILFAIVALLCLIAIGPWPYAFYTPMRVIVSVGFIFLTYRAARTKRRVWIVPAIALSILFAPGLPWHWEKGTWVLLDMIAATAYVMAATDLGKPSQIVEVDDDDAEYGSPITHEMEANTKSWVAPLLIILGIIWLIMNAYIFGQGQVYCTEYETDLRGGYCTG